MIAEATGFERRAPLGPDQARRPAPPPARHLPGARAVRVPSLDLPADGLRETAVEWYLANRDEADKQAASSPIGQRRSGSGELAAHF